MAEKWAALSRRPNLTLILISVLGLFLELMLIRWIGTDVSLFSYLGNALLVVCFLGLGLGCLSSRQPFAVRDITLPLATLLLLLALPWTRSVLQQIGWLLQPFDSLTDLQSALANTWQTIPRALVGFFLLGTLMVLVWSVFVPIGRLLARSLDDHPNTIRAYSVNVAASLLGIWLFVFLSALYQPPVVWMGVTAALLLGLLLLQGRPAVLDLVSLPVLIGLAWLGGLKPEALEVVWSPYQRLELVQHDEFASNIGVGEYIIMANSGNYQGMIDLSPTYVREHPDRYPPGSQGLSQYDLPYLFKPNPAKVLIVGAGSGNDASGAIRNGAREIVAVDIDPAIIDLGRRYHPEHPYTPGNNVRVVNDDARSFFATTSERFDLIVFGLLDCPHASNAMTNARLDHYVYTQESLARARSLLTEDGVLVLTFEPRLREFLPTRLFENIRGAFGSDPLFVQVPLSSYGWGAVVFVAAEHPETVRQNLAANPRLSKQFARWKAVEPATLIRPGSVPPATDDWPYIYLDRPQVPLLFGCFTVLLVLLFAGGVYRLKIPGLFNRWQRSDAHFFFLGAAFLLLEVQNVSKAAVVLGNTWQVNAVVISGVLGLVLLANFIVARFSQLPLLPVYGLLIGSALGLYFIDLSTFAFLPYITKIFVVGGLISLPMLFSGIVFIRSFATVPHKDTALGANLLGSLVGALLQTVTFLTGIKALLLIVAALYAAAFLMRPRTEAAIVPVAPIPTEEPAATPGT